MVTTELLAIFATLSEQYSNDQIVYVADHAIDLSVLPPHPTFVLNAGESGKTLETVQQIWDFLFANEITRRGLMVCIGGGTTTDIGGFAAATYKRGIDYINIPTTLLGMVDASTGGKTGINYRGIKNSIGAFHQPVETIIWPNWLKTLPTHELLSGFAEMLKTGLIANEQLWYRLLQFDLDAPTLDEPQLNELSSLIEECVAAKTRIVNSDPHESGLRKALNLGHTFGHALEEINLTGESGLTAQRSRSDLESGLTGKAGLPHGYAVLYGLIAELYLSVVILDFNRTVLLQLSQLMLHYYGRPECKCSDRERLLQLMRQDKKNEHAAVINCTLLRAIGEPVINQVISDEQALEAWEYLFSL